MKNITNFINERLHITTKSHIHHYTCQPETWDELREIIVTRIYDDGFECDLNDIDVSKIKDMSYLFNASGNSIFERFNGDVSQWNVSNVTNMRWMFKGCKKFNCDISYWDVSNVKDMENMFYMCKKFNCDLSRWDVSKVTNMECMFCKCAQFNCDISRWNISNVKNIYRMFKDCKLFKQNLNRWNVSNIDYTVEAFKRCPTTPNWYNRNTCEP